ncbi:MAG TPA: hypothetical protein VGK73_25260 [Polyangiaceae bacterium]
MSEPQTPPKGEPAPSPVPAPSPAPQNTPATPAAAKVEMTSEQLNERLAEAQSAAVRKLLKQHGFSKDEDLGAALKKLKDAEQATLTEQEKLKKQLDELSPKAKRTEALETQFSALVDEQFKALPENVQKAVDSEAEGDPEARLILMRVLRAAGLGSMPAPATTTPAVTPPATAAPSPAPAPSGAPTKFQEWESMRARNSTLGDIFYQTHQREIERTRPASA